MRQMILALAVVPALLLSHPAAADPLPSDARILQILARRVDLQKQATGIVIGIATPAGDQFVSYGRMGLDDPRHVYADTIYDVGSITKMFTALMLADLAREGRIDLNAPAQDYLPKDKVTLPTRNGRAITVADLATHMAGFPLRPDNLTSTDPDDKYAGYRNEDLFRYVSGFTLPRDPGSAYEYSNVGYGLLGALLEARTGLDYETLLRQRVTGPLDMTATGIAPTPATNARHAIGYGPDLKPAPHWDFSALAAAGGAHASARDLLRLLHVALGFEKSPLAPAFKTMTSIRRPGGMQPATDIALAWNILKIGDREIVWKNGSVGGFRAFIGYDLKEKRGIVALANAQTAEGADDIGLHLLNPKAASIDTHIPVPHHEIALAPEALRRFTGRYVFGPGDVILVSVKDGQLIVRQEGTMDDIPFYAESEKSVFCKLVDIQIDFGADATGKMVTAIWHQRGDKAVGKRDD